MMMKKWICCALLLSGCGYSKDEFNEPIDATSQDRPARQVLQSVSKAEADTVTMQPVKLAGQPKSPASDAAAKQQEELPDNLARLLAPLAEGECFFSAPVEKKVEIQSEGEVKESGTQRESIRLLGFVQLGDVEASKSQAILRINGKLAYVSEGDQLDDLEVLSIAAPVVTFQQQRQRWSINLHDQPSSKGQATSRFVSTRPPTQSARRRYAEKATLSSQASTPPLPLPTPTADAQTPGISALPGMTPLEASQPSQPNASGLGALPPEPEAPQLPQLPELPVTPELPKLPDDLELDE